MHIHMRHHVIINIRQMKSTHVSCVLLFLFTITLLHSPSLSLTLLHSPSLSSTLLHSPSPPLTLLHSPSLSFTLLHSPSFFFTFLHSHSPPLTLIHSPSLQLVLPFSYLHNAVFCAVVPPPPPPCRGIHSVRSPPAHHSTKTVEGIRLPAALSLELTRLCDVAYE
jgi:hypothetical protein